MAISVMEICDAIEGILGTAAGITTTQSPDTLTEGLQDLPLFQVYPDAGTQDPGGSTDRSSFGGGVMQHEVIINADLYVRQRSNLAEDMKAVVDRLDDVITVMQAQKHSYFGKKDEIKSMKWRWARVVFAYGEPEVKYVGIRFVITVRVF
jgi:enoyl reductase-like protein